MIKTTIAELFEKKTTLIEVEVKGWVKSFRANRFIALNDGSTIKNMQCVVDFENLAEDFLNKITVGASLKVQGDLVESQGKGQDFEIQVSNIEVLGQANPELVSKTILQPKKHSLEFLREQAHLRPRTNTFGAVMRLRSSLSFAIHRYFHTNGFNYMHSPIITGSDAEGAGEMFRVTTLDPKNPPLTKGGEVDYSKDFFGKETNLTVSGQLELKLMQWP
jgi:asparaginyl-tRNA synthetase